MAANLFTYGLLQSRVVMRRVIGRDLASRPARLEDHARYRFRQAPYPGAVPEPGGVIEGRLYEGLDAALLTRVDEFEGYEYQRSRCRVIVALGEIVPADVYLVRPAFRSRLSSEPWDPRVTT